MASRITDCVSLFVVLLINEKDIKSPHSWSLWGESTRDRRIEPVIPLQWRHDERDGISNHQPHDCLLNCLFRCWSKKTAKLRVTGLCEENSLVTGKFPAQRQVTRKMFPFDNVIMQKVFHVMVNVSRDICLYSISYILFGNVSDSS